jgi:methionyl-tRNA formyltransferase
VTIKATNESREERAPLSGRDVLDIVFMGTPDFAVPSLEALVDRHNVEAVVTNPDRRKGRGRRKVAPPVKQVSEEAGLRVLQPDKVNVASFVEEIREMEPDVIVVVAYGHILRERLLTLPPMGCVNVHASLLPAYRGAAPIQWAIMKGERRTGVTIMQMDRGMDTGPILAQRDEPIRPDDTAASLSERLARLGASTLVEALEGLEQGVVQPKPQPPEGTKAPMLKKSDGRVDWNRPAGEVKDLVRGTDPWPGAFTELEGERLRLFGASLAEGSGSPGEVLGLEGDSLVVACGRGAVSIDELQLPGRKRMSARALTAGRALPPSTILG